MALVSATMSGGVSALLKALQEKFGLTAEPVAAGARMFTATLAARLQELERKLVLLADAAVQ